MGGVDVLRCAGGVRSLRELDFGEKLNVCVLAPHPDDFDTVGVTVKYLMKCGYSIQLGVVCTGSGIEDCYRPGASTAEKVGIRSDEQKRSLDFFGLAEECSEFLALEKDSDEQLVDSKFNRYRLAGFLLRRQPDVVLLPHGKDTNSGHRRMYVMFKQYAQECGRAIAAFLIRDPKTVQMRPDLYVAFGEDEAKWKGELLRFHDSQHQRNLNTRGHGFDERILSVNRQIATELELAEEYAEAFEVQVFGKG